MMDKLRLLLSSQLKRCKLTQKTGGFTLIELLVAMLLAALVITPLLGFMINIMDSERKEQAKATSEQEIQASLDYIAQDLEQAVYIYDGEGIAAIEDELPYDGDNTKVPVLVFWKRRVIQNAIKFDGAECTDADATANDCNDRFVYSLVAYYLIKDTNWSEATQIDRFEISDGLQNPNDPLDDDGNPQYIGNHQPDDGFKRFNLQAQGNTLKAKMNQWEGDEDDYDLYPNVLVDFIDQSTSGVPAPVDCSNALGLDSSVDDQNLRVPRNPPSTLNTNSFYACVDSSRALAQVYIRGNALVRIVSNDQIASQATYSSSRTAYFPTANVQIQGRGFLSVE